MSDNTKIKLSALTLIYLFILCLTMLTTIIPVTIWWLFTDQMINNILFINICLVTTTVIFVASTIIGTITHKK